MIKGRCETNLDGYDCSKVKVFAEVPNKGSRIVVFFNGAERTLKVCDITHDVKDNEPYIIIGLTKDYII